MAIKSQRHYQLGVVYRDEYGRETPVQTNDTGGLYIPKTKLGFDRNARPGDPNAYKMVQNVTDDEGTVFEYTPDDTYISDLSDNDQSTIEIFAVQWTNGDGHSP